MHGWRPQLPGMKTTVASTPQVRRLGVGVIIASVAAIAIATLFPAANPPVTSHFCLICGYRGGADAILNVILFLPLGVGLALTRVRAKFAVPAIFALSAAIETTQLFLIAGRDAAIGDLVMNTLGGALGFAIGQYAFTLLRPSPRKAFALCVGWSAIWLAIQTISAFGFSPAMPAAEYYGEIAPPLANFDQFRGRVVRAGIDDITVPNGQFEDSRKLRDMLLRGATITTIIVPAGPTRDIAPIVRVADARRGEILLLAQDGERFIFGVRTGAGVLRLRVPFFALPVHFSGVSPIDSEVTTADTVRVSAQYSAREVRLNAQTARASSDRLIPITASLGWTMLLPFQWFIEGTRIERIVSGIWIACLLLPLGYWGAGITRGSGDRVGRIQLTGALIALAILYVGLAVVPQTFGESGAPLSDWLAGLTGILLGRMLQARVSTGAPENGAHSSSAGRANS
jgi:hypothetical protein